MCLRRFASPLLWFLSFLSGCSTLLGADFDRGRAPADGGAALAPLEDDASSEDDAPLEHDASSEDDASFSGSDAASRIEASATDVVTDRGSDAIQGDAHSGDAQTCIPSCVGKACGSSDGCGGVCNAGSCATGQHCVAGTCKCDAASCTGCCDGTTCRAGASNDACGQGGEACSACTTGSTCQSGDCVANLCRALGEGCSGTSECCWSLDCGRTGVCCLGFSALCASDSNCCSGRCVDSACTCTNVGQTCATTRECCGDLECKLNKCVRP